MKYILIALGILIAILIPARASEAEMTDTKVAASLNSILNPKPHISVTIDVVKSQDEIDQEAKAISAQKASFVVKLQKQAVNVQNVVISDPREPIPRSDYCSCVLTVQAITGYNIHVGLARNWPTNSPIPVAGGVVVLNESYAGHVAVITKVVGTTIYLQEGNYNRCQFSERTINTTDRDIIGYWKQ